MRTNGSLQWLRFVDNWKRPQQCDQRNQRTLQESAWYTGREGGRVAGGGTDEIRVGDKSQDGEADRPDDPAEGAGKGEAMRFLGTVFVWQPGRSFIYRRYLQ